MATIIRKQRSQSRDLPLSGPQQRRGYQGHGTWHEVCWLSKKNIYIYKRMTKLKMIKWWKFLLSHHFILDWRKLLLTKRFFNDFIIVRPVEYRDGVLNWQYTMLQWLARADVVTQTTRQAEKLNHKERMKGSGLLSQSMQLTSFPGPLSPFPWRGRAGGIKKEKKNRDPARARLSMQPVFIARLSPQTTT